MSGGLSDIVVTAATAGPVVPLSCCGTGLREALRAATRGVHERLHRHPGLAAVAAGRISPAAYGRLLTRLLGFYGPLEAALALPAERSLWLRADLASLEAPHAELPVASCPYLPRADVPAARLGARYVIEGAALGGQLLARRLEGLLRQDGPAGRQFFIGRGSGTALAWQTFLTELAAFEVHTASSDAVIASACDTFTAFERWMDGWEDRSI